MTYGTEVLEGTEGQTEFTLANGDKVTVTPTEKGAAGVKNVSESGDNSFTWTVENEDSYTKGEDTIGKLTITKVDVTITMEDRTLPYNGQTQYGWSRTDEGTKSSKYAPFSPNNIPSFRCIFSTIFLETSPLEITG